MIAATRLAAFLAVACLSGLAHGMKCSIGDTNIISQALNSCPGLLDSPENEFCCYDFDKGKTYCCNSMEFAMKSSWFLIVVVVGVILVVSLLVSCICCLCCRCCPWYRRRHRGTVYQSVLPTMAINVIHGQPQVNTAYVRDSTDAAHQQQQTSPYSSAVYEKQAPYNPNYPTST